MRKKLVLEILLSISFYILGRDVLQLVDSIVEFPLDRANIILFIVSCIFVYSYYKKDRDKTLQRVFFVVFMIGIWNLLSKILIFVPYNAQSSLGVFLGIACVFVIGLPVSGFITDRIDKFLRKRE